MTSVGILGTGKSLPEKSVTNHDLIKMGLDTSDDWIKDRTGIAARRIAEKDTETSDLASEAGKQAIQNAKIQPEDIDLIIVATSTPDYLGFPSTACVVQRKLGIKSCAAFDLSAACTGFNYALTCGEQFIKTGLYQHILVIGADCLSKRVDWTDRSTCILFGDGAGAVVLGRTEEGHGILSSAIYANGDLADILMVKQDSEEERLNRQGEAFIRMNGRQVYKVAVEVITPAIKDALQKAGIQRADLNKVILHQANLRIIRATQERLGLDDDHMVTNIQHYGNTSAASIPIALAELVESNQLKKGDVLALMGFGAGFTWGTNILKW